MCTFIVVEIDAVYDQQVLIAIDLIALSGLLDELNAGTRLRLFNIVGQRLPIQRDRRQLSIRAQAKP